MKSYKQYLSDLVTEAKEVPVEDYNDLLKSIYSKEFSDLILSQDELLSDMMGKDPTVETTGNLYVKYLETPNDAFIIGLLSKSGKMKRDDVDDFKIWKTRLTKALEKGKTVYTSVNKFSRPLINKLIKDYDVTSMGKLNFPDGEWETIMVSKP